MLGMVIGTASIIAVFGISKGATSGITATIRSFGTSPIFVMTDPTQDYPDLAQLQFRDVASVAAALGDRVDEVLPYYQRSWQVRYGTKTEYLAVTADGAYHSDAFSMAQGRKIDQDDVDSAARVAFVTTDVAKKFFGDSPALGKELAINGTHFTVAGVYPQLQGSFFNALAGSNTIVIPYTTFHRIMPGVLDGLMVYPRDAADTPAIQAAIKAALRHVHGPRAQYIEQDSQSQVQSFENVLGIIGAGLSAIGAVALLVAGIGIMNIMLVSVTERTREIGIRKSIGASRRDVALQFLLEALLLAFAGGATGTVIGLAVTIGGAALISRELGAVIVPYALIVAIAVVFSFAVGTVFGTYPALRAAAMDPVEALRS